MPRDLPLPKNKDDLYDRFRPPLTEAQRQTHDGLLKAARAASEAPDSPGKKADEAAKYQALSDFFRDVALSVADSQLANIELPEDEDIWRHFPDVDPRGHYSELELGYARRRDRVEALLQMRTQETRTAVKSLLESEEFRKLEGRLQAVTYQQRRLTRAEKVADHSVQMRLHTEAAALVGARVQVMENGRAVDCNPVVDMEKAMTGIEYLLGIKRGPLTPEIQQFFQNEFHFDIARQNLAQFRTLVRPSEMVFHYPDFNNQCVQRNFSQPQNWGVSLLGLPRLSTEALEEQRFAYSVGTAMKTLDTMFGDAERLEAEAVEKQTANGTERYERYAYDRADLIIIGGKTAREILAEEFETGELKGRYETAAKRTFQDFQDFYDVYGHEAVADLVGSAMLSETRVEAFIPHGKGGVFAADEPVRLTQMGFERSKLPPVELSAWEKFWNRFGFFKEKKALADEYASVTAARERVKFNNLSERAKVLAAKTEAIDGVRKQSKREFFGDRPLPKDSPRKYSFERSAGTSFAVMQMVIEGYPLDKIFDPAALQAEKLAAGQKVIQIFQGTDNVDAEMQFFRDAAAKFPAALDKLVADHPLPDDVSALSSPEYFPLIRACAAGFDASQEMKRARNAMVAQGREVPDHEQISDALSAMAPLGDCMRRLNRSRAEILTGKFSSGRASQGIADYLTAAAFLKGALQKSREAGRTTPVSQVFTYVGTGTLMASAQTAVAGLSEGLAERYDKMPEARDTLRRAVVSDELIRTGVFKMGEGMQVDVELPGDLFPPLPKEPEEAKAPKAAKPKEKAL